MNTAKVVVINEDCPCFIDFMLNKKFSVNDATGLVDFKKTDSPFKFEKFINSDTNLNVYECSEVDCFFLFTNVDSMSWKILILKSMAEVLISEKCFIIITFKMNGTVEEVATKLTNQYLKILIKVK